MNAVDLRDLLWAPLGGPRRGAIPLICRGISSGERTLGFAYDLIYDIINGFHAYDFNIDITYMISYMNCRTVCASSRTSSHTPPPQELRAHTTTAPPPQERRAQIITHAATSRATRAHHHTLRRLRSGARTPTRTPPPQERRAHIITHATASRAARAHHNRAAASGAARANHHTRRRIKSDARTSSHAPPTQERRAHTIPAL